MKFSSDLTRIELHVHLEGAVRISTICDLAQQKGLPYPKTVKELTDRIVFKQPAKDLFEFLEHMLYYMPVIIGDLKALKRIAYELVETQFNNKVAYFEVRYAPNLLIGDPSLKITADDVVNAVNEGLRQGESEFGVIARSILCCLRGHANFSLDVLRLCQKFHNDTVVGIDIAGCCPDSDPEKYEPETVKALEGAKQLGIHRTVHAGEAGTYVDVQKALELCFAERIGHGYHVLGDENLYQQLLRDRIHLETCPYSSLMTSAVKVDPKKHPVVRFANDNANFSLSTDDPTVLGNSVDWELNFCRNKLELSEKQIAQAQINAAESCFLPDELKKLLVDHIKRTNQ